MLPWMPMSPPVPRLRSATYPAAGSAVWVVAVQVRSGAAALNTTFGVWLMKSANGCMSDVGQCAAQVS